MRQSPSSSAAHGTGSKREPVSPRRQLERLLLRHGVDGYCLLEEETSVTLRLTVGERQLQLMVPLPDRWSDEFTRTSTGRVRLMSAQERAYEREVRRRWSALRTLATGKLMAAKYGISDLEDDYPVAVEVTARDLDEPALDRPAKRRYVRLSRAVLPLIGFAAVIPASSIAAVSLSPATVQRLVTPLSTPRPDVLASSAAPQRVALGIESSASSAPGRTLETVARPSSGFVAQAVTEHDSAPAPSSTPTKGTVAEPDSSPSSSGSAPGSDQGSAPSATGTPVAATTGPGAGPGDGGGPGAGGPGTGQGDSGGPGTGGPGNGGGGSGGGPGNGGGGSGSGGPGNGGGQGSGGGHGHGGPGGGNPGGPGNGNPGGPGDGNPGGPGNGNGNPGGPGNGNGNPGGPGNGNDNPGGPGDGNNNPGGPGNGNGNPGGPGNGNGNPAGPGNGNPGGPGNGNPGNGDPGNGGGGPAHGGGPGSGGPGDPGGGPGHGGH